MLSDELQVALLAALHAIMRVAIPRAEATVRAGETYRFALVLLGIVQRIFVELVLLQLFVAGIAAPRRTVALALDAIFCIGREGSWHFRLPARRAGMAGGAAENPVL